MTLQHARHHAVSCLILLCLGLSSIGCSRWMDVKAVEPAAAGSEEALRSASIERVPAVLTTINMTQNGSIVAPADGLERRVLDTLAETELFSKLVYPGYSDAVPAGQHVRAKLSVAVYPEPHAGSAAWKGIVIGASMFLLAPVLPLEYEYAARMTLDLEREDGSIHRYLAGAEGVAHYHLFGATHLAVDELKATILESCLNQIQRELVKDREFVQAGFLAHNKSEPRSYQDFTAIPTVAPGHRQTRTISILRSTAR